MDIRKIGVAAGFAAGAAFAFAPLASADTTPDFTSIIASEAASLNGMFQLDTALSGVTPDQYSLVDGFYVINPEDVEAVQGNGTTLFDYLIYGLNPTGAGLADDPGSYNVLNGALTEFYDAYNVSVYPLLGGTGDIPATDLIGSADNIAAGLDSDNPALFFFNFGLSDLAGYLGLGPAEAASTAAAEPAAVIDITPLLTSEVESLNGLFATDVASAMIDSDKIIQGTGTLPFDTILSTDTNDAFNALVFGAADPSTDPGSYSVFNGALTELLNATNVGVYALLNGGDILPTADLFGPTDFLDMGVSGAISEYLSLSFSDLLGFFIPAM